MPLGQNLNGDIWKGKKRGKERKISCCRLPFVRHAISRCLGETVARARVCGVKVHIIVTGAAPKFIHKGPCLRSYIFNRWSGLGRNTAVLHSTF